MRGLTSCLWSPISTPGGNHGVKIEGDFSIATADATRVCRELGLVVAGLTVVNTAILGAFIRATEIVGMPSLEQAIRERFSDSTVDINLSAIMKTFEITKLAKVRG